MKVIEEELRIVTHIVASQIKALDSTTNRYISSQLDQLVAFREEFEDLQNETKLIRERVRASLASLAVPTDCD
jgi:hypothetical protein